MKMAAYRAVPLGIFQIVKCASFGDHVRMTKGCVRPL
jgi:hypothetical protein